MTRVRDYLRWNNGYVHENEHNHNLVMALPITMSQKNSYFEIRILYDQYRLGRIWTVGRSEFKCDLTCTCFSPDEQFLTLESIENCRQNLNLSPRTNPMKAMTRSPSNVKNISTKYLVTLRHRDPIETSYIAHTLGDCETKCNLYPQGRL